MKIISNTSPLIFLAKIEKLYLLKNYELTIPNVVFREVEKKREDQTYFIIKKFIQDNKIKIQDVELLKKLPNSLGDGEKGVISLAVKEGVKNVIIDEKKARTIAKSYNLIPKGTLALLATAVKKKEISERECKELILGLLKKGYRIDQKLIMELIEFLGNK
ncbi:DUF3368 domain-containing protein [Candidatus Woesearchaeota archaeon]|nr:DUF3368 domain-containing protein [Candidatus Woesearchaeota archaeon]